MPWYTSKGSELRKKTCVSLSTSILLIIVCALMISSAECNSNTFRRELPTEAINQGLEAGKAIADLIDERNFSGTLGKVATSISSFLGALGPFVAFIGSFFGSGESAELKYMKQMMKDINNRFDKIDARFYDIERSINWAGTKITFAQIEQKIVSLSDDFRLYFESSKSGHQDRKNIFKRNYENAFANSASILYEAIKRQNLFQDELEYAVMKYTENNRADTQLFLLGVLKLLLQAVKLELVYYHMKYPNLEHQQRDAWVTRLKEVKTSYEKIDATVKNKYHEQSGLDLQQFLTKYYKHSNQEFADALYKFLSKKYYWRDWIVLAYNPITGDDVHWLLVRGGHSKFRDGGRNYGVTSVDKSQPKLSRFTAAGRLSHAKQERISKRIHTHHPLTASDVFKSLDTNGAYITSVVRKNNGLHVSAAPERLTTYSSGPYYDMTMWG